MSIQLPDTFSIVKNYAIHKIIALASVSTEFEQLIQGYARVLWQNLTTFWVVLA